MDLEQTERITYLIAHRFTETLSLQEEEELESWLAEDDRNRQFMEDLLRQHFFAQRKQEGERFNSKVAFRKVQKRYRRRNDRFRRWVISASTVAAVVALFIGGILWFDLLREEEVPQEGVLADLSAGNSKAVLTLASGRRIELGQEGIGDTIVANVGSWLKVTQKELEYKDTGSIRETEYNVLEIPRRGEFKLILADGTEVWLNSESRIKYPIKFGAKERRIYLEGEAYFEVSENKEVPFIVDMGKASVQVLGTSFNARAYKDESGIYATLTKGKICLNTGKQSLILQPEEQGFANVSTGELTKKRVDSRLYTGWRDGRFIFQEQTLEEMMNTLSRWYNIQIFFENPAIMNITFSGNLKRYDSFDKIIEMLEMTDVAHFNVKGNAIFISE